MSFAHLRTLLLARHFFYFGGVIFRSGRVLFYKHPHLVIGRAYDMSLIDFHSIFFLARFVVLADNNWIGLDGLLTLYGTNNKYEKNIYANTKLT